MKLCLLKLNKNIALVALFNKNLQSRELQTMCIFLKIHEPHIWWQLFPWFSEFYAHKSEQDNKLIACQCYLVSYVLQIGNLRPLTHLFEIKFTR